MKRKHRWILPCVIAALLLLAVGLFMNGKEISVGRCVVADNGAVLWVNGAFPIMLEHSGPFDGVYNTLQTGDKIWLIHANAVAESWPGVVRTYACLRLEKGSAADVPAAVLDDLTKLGWLGEPIDEEFLFAEDFSFAITFGTYGISSYDSATGRLVKSTDATHPEDYVTTMTLGADELAQIRATLQALDLASYPATYDPYNDPDSPQRIYSDPSQTLILTVRTAVGTTTVTCRDIPYHNAGYDDKAQAFLDACIQICTIVTGTEEWQSLPEYEFFYD